MHLCRCWRRCSCRTDWT